MFSFASEQGGGFCHNATFRASEHRARSITRQAWRGGYEDGEKGPSPVSNPASPYSPAVHVADSFRLGSRGIPQRNAFRKTGPDLFLRFGSRKENDLRSPRRRHGLEGSPADAC